MFSYDNQGFLVTETDAKGNTISYTYDGNGNVLSITNEMNETMNMTYDVEDRLQSLTSPLGHSLTYAYDATGNLVSETNETGETTRYVYDALNRVTEIYDAKDIKVYSAQYDSAGNLTTLTDALNNTSTQSYDSLNRITQSVDPLKRATTFSYDNLGRLTAMSDPLQGNASRSFDALGQVTSVEDPNHNTTSYTYDLVGRLTSEIDASGGTHSYRYNALGLLSGETNGRNQSTDYTYDAARRLTAFTDPDGTVSYDYDANGNVTQISENGETLTRTYDKLDRIDTYTDQDGNTLTYTYDADGNLITLTYPDGKAVHYTYDAAGRMKTVTDWNNRVTSYSYDANGQLVSTIRPNGTTEQRTYDANGQLTRLWDLKSDGTVIYDSTYQYNGVGNVVTETINGKPSVTSSVYGTEPTPTFDINGPGLSPNQELFLSENVDMTYTADNRLATYNGSEVDYDADGNMIVGPLQGSMQSYRYDSRNRLVEAGGVSYVYNSENIRTSVTANGVTTNYVVNPNAVLSQVLMEKDGKGQTEAWYVYGLGLIGREDSAGNYLSYHYDRRGSTIAITDVSEQVTDIYTYGIYGESLDHQGATDQPFRYNGRDGVMTDSNGLYYMRARYYNPEIKRFVNRDVVTGTISSSQTLNRYAYVNGNPISYIDPFGLSRDGDSVWLQATSFFADALPGIGTIKGFQQAFTGRDYITGEYLSVADRWAEGIGSALSFIPIPGIKHIGTYGTEGIINASSGLTKIISKKIDYKSVFFGKHPNLKGKVVVHHSIEQQVLRKPEYKGLFTEEEMHDYINLRGIPKELNSDLHLSKIRKEWNTGIDFIRNILMQLKNKLLINQK